MRRSPKSTIARSVALLLVLILGTAHDSRANRDLPSSENGSSTDFNNSGSFTTIFLDHYGSDVSINGSATDIKGMVDTLTASVQLFRWGSIAFNFNNSPPTAQPISNGHTLIQVVLNAIPTGSTISSAIITEVAISPTNSSPLQSPWYGYVDTSCGSSCNPPANFWTPITPPTGKQYVGPQLSLMVAPAGYKLTDTAYAANPDFISAATPVTAADTNTTIWTFGSATTPSSGIFLPSALVKNPNCLPLSAPSPPDCVTLQVAGIPGASSPVLANVLSPTNLPSNYTFASPPVVNGLDSITNANVAVVVYVTFNNGTAPQYLVLGNLGLTAGTVRANPAAPLTISSLPFSETASLANASISASQLSYLTTAQPSAPACTALANQGATALPRSISYQYMPAYNETVTIDTSGSHFDTVLLLSSTTDTNYKPTVCYDQDQSGSTLQAKSPSVPLQAGATYNITAGEFPSFNEYFCSTQTSQSASTGCNKLLSPLTTDPVLKFTLTVAKQDSTSAGLSCPASVSAGLAVTCTATVTDTTNSTYTPAGSVQFTFTPTGSSSAAVNTTGTLPGPPAIPANNTAQGVANGLLAGTYQVAATYQPSDGLFMPPANPTSATVTVVLNPTTASAVAPTSAPIAGSSFNINGSVSHTTGTAAPTGTLTLLDNGTATGATASASSTPVALAVTNATVGTHSYTVKYSGDTIYATSTSSPVSVVVGKDTSSVALSSSSASISQGASATLTATVSDASGTGLPPTGTVTFLNNSVALGTPVTLVNGVATLTTSALSTTPGTDSLTASYVGDSNFNSSSTATALSVVILNLTTISNFTVANHTYGDAPFSVTATSNSSGTFTYSVVSGPATISGSTVTLTGAGTVVLQASEAATSSYTAATQNATFTVAPATPSISFAVPNQTYGAAPFSVTATSNSSGAFTYSVVSGPAIISGSTVTLTGAGTVVLQASEAATSNYAAATKSATFTIATATPTITFTVSSQTYGAAPFSVAATSNSSGAFTYSVVSGPATISGSTVTLTGAGTVVLQASVAATSSYTAATQTATFTVNKATSSITLTPSATSINQNASVTLTATVTNASSTSLAPTGMVTFYNGSATLQTVSLVSGVATLPTSPSFSATAGTYPLTASYLGDSNFNASTSSTQNVVVVAPAFSDTLEQPTLTVDQGSSGSVKIDLSAAGGFVQTLTFSCSGLPAQTTCIFNPTTITPDAAGDPASTVMTISTNVASASLSPLRLPHRGPALPTLVVAAVFLFAGRLRKAARSRPLRLLLMTLVLACAASCLVGCGSGGSGGGGGNTQPVTPVGTYTVTVTATPTGGSTGSAKTLSLQLTIAS